MKVYEIIVLFRGNMQIFHYQTEKEFIYKIPPTKFFWKDLKDGNICGPFDNIYNAIDHFSQTAKNNNLQANLNLIPNNLIKVDFVAKRRL